MQSTRNSCGLSTTTWNHLFPDETILAFYHQLLTLPALGTAGRLGLGDWRWKHRQHGLEGIVGIGIGSTHSSSSRSAESDEIVREKSTVVTLRDIVLLPIIGAALSVMGPMGCAATTLTSL